MTAHSPGDPRKDSIPLIVDAHVHIHDCYDDEFLDWTRPWARVRPLLSDPGITLEPYGRLERTIPFFRNQFGMQMRKRLRSR